MNGPCAPLFDRSVKSIKLAYMRLGQTIGWRFLMGPRETLSRKTSIGIISLNPGGAGNPLGHPSESYEGGSAYMDEAWPGYAAGAAPLQRQMQGLCTLLQQKLGDARPLREFMAHGIVAAYFIPFRSQNMKVLKCRQASIRFAENLWRDVLAEWNPRLIITIDREAFKSVSKIVLERTSVGVDHIHWPSGWGDYNCETLRFSGGVTLARLPHLSRFSLFHREASELQMSRLFDYLCDPLVSGAEGATTERR